MSDELKVECGDTLDEYRDKIYHKLKKYSDNGEAVTPKSIRCALEELYSESIDSAMINFKESIEIDIDKGSGRVNITCELPLIISRSEHEQED